MAFLVSFLSIFFSVLHLGFAFNANGFDFALNSEQYFPTLPMALFGHGNNEVTYLAEKQFTFCFHAFLDNYKNRKVENLFSYLCAESFKEILVQLRHDLNELNFYIKGELHPFKVLPPREKWTHICFSWNNNGGVLKAYFDGKEVAKAKGFQNGVSLNTKDGSLSLGQNQNILGGNYNEVNGIRGKITYFNAWDRELTADEVIQVRSCNLEGNIVRWSNASWVMSGHADIEPSSAPCRDPCKRSELEAEHRCDHPTTLSSDNQQTSIGKVSPNRASFNLPDNVKFKEFTLCAWVYYEAKYDQNLNYYIDRRNPFDNAKIFMKINGTNMIFTIYDETFSTSGPVPDNWQHICAIWSGINNDSIEIYINGKQLLYSALKKHGESFSGGNLNFYQYRYANYDPQNPVKGYAQKVTGIDMWDYVLTPEKVIQTYNCRTELPGNVIDWGNSTKRG